MLLGRKKTLSKLDNLLHCPVFFFFNSLNIWQIETCEESDRNKSK